MSSPGHDTGTTKFLSPAAEFGNWVWALRGLAITGLGLTAYLTWSALTASPVVGCGGSDVFDCSHVLNSKWSKIGSIPVGVPAFGLYCTLVSALAFCRHSQIEQVRKLSWICTTTCGIAAGLAALWFTGLQIVALEHFCLWCLAAHFCGLMICCLLLWKRPLGNRTTAQLTAIGTMGVAVFITAQVSIPAPPTFEVLHYEETKSESAEKLTVAENNNSAIDDFNDDAFAAPDNLFEAPEEATATESVTDAKQDKDSSDDSTSPAAAASLLLLLPQQIWQITNLLRASLESDDESPAKNTDKTKEKQDAESTPPQKDQPERRLIRIHGNKFRLDIRKWPLLGNPEAKYVFVELFDYTCSHCRNTNRAVRGAFDRYGDDLAVIALPVPLDRKCNRHASSSGGAHRDSCEIAQIAVAVWRIDAEQFHELHNWLFETSRTATSTRQRAEELVGKEALTRELKYPTAGQYIAKHVQLYKAVGAGSVPKVMFPSSSMVGEINSTNRLCSAIERELANR